MTNCCVEGARHLYCHLSSWWHGSHEISFCPFCGTALTSDEQEGFPEIPSDGPPVTVCFDVDEVLADPGDPWRDYRDRDPYPFAAEMVKRVWDSGCGVVFQTARYMARCGNDQQKAHEAGHAELCRWLDKHNIHRGSHDLVFTGKVSADIYADDRGCRVESARGIVHWRNSLVPLIRRIKEKKRLLV